jgi:hypothetical protein
MLFSNFQSFDNIIVDMLLETTTMLSLQYSVIPAAEEALPRASDQEFLLALPDL